ncbi:hypothetical protein [Shigella sp. FC1967]
MILLPDPNSPEKKKIRRSHTECN